MAVAHKPVRTTAAFEGEFVVFLVGMRLNKPLAVRRWWPMVHAMRDMIAELKSRPESGFLHAETGLGRTVVVVQYWRSLESLIAYANDSASPHYPAWRRFYEGADGSVGFWHEAYAVRGGAYESVYVDMPPFGLGAFGELRPADGSRKTGEGRLRSNREGL